MRRTVPALLVVLVAGALTAACSGSTQEKAETRTSSSPPPTTTESVEIEQAPVYAEGKRGEYDRLAADKGWYQDGGYIDMDDPVSGTDAESTAYPSHLVLSVCKDIREHLAGEGPNQNSSPAQDLAERELGQDASNAAALKAGIPMLCGKKENDVLKQAESGDYERWFGNGTFKVGDGKGFDSIPPGTYKAEGDIRDAYWERTSKSGDILDNKFVTSAQEVTVTIRPGDGQFTSRNVGVWKPVR